MKPDVDKSLRVIRLRAEELSRRNVGELGTSEAEVLASLVDGGRTFDGVDDETLERCLTRFGPDAVIDALVAAAAVDTPAEEAQTPVASVTVVRGAFNASRRDTRRPQLVWLAAAASILLAVAALWWLPRPDLALVPQTHQGPAASPGRNAPSPTPGPVARRPNREPAAPSAPTQPGSGLALSWPATPTFDASGPTWRPSQAALPMELPSFEQAGRTLGADGGTRYVQWRLKTVIVRSANGWGSGAFISADGWILSNYHVVAQAAQEAALTGAPAVLDIITAQEVEGRIKPRPAMRATLYRGDPVRDLALLKLQSPPEVPFFSLARAVRDGEDCFVVGSQHNGPAWSIRSGTVLHQFDYPDDLSQVATGVASPGVALERNRVTVTVSDASVSRGDSGGPLLNAQGELIGLTFATSANESGGAVGWHVGLDPVRRFAEPTPARPEGVPYDPWTGGLPHAATLRPQLIDGDGDGRLDTLLYHYVNPPRPGAAEPQPVATTMFVDFAQRTTARPEGGGSRDTLAPLGLWGMEDRGAFRFDVFLAIRADGHAIVGYTAATGVVDEMRVGRAAEMTAAVVWRRRAAGTWGASRPTAPTQLIDGARIGSDRGRRLEAIARRVMGGSSSVPPAGPDSPRARDPRGPNKLGAQP